MGFRAFIDLHTATTGSTGAVDILVDTVGRFTEYVRTLCKGLPQIPTRPTGLLLVLAAMELHASLYGTMVSYEASLGRIVCPLEWICRSIRIMRLCKSFVTNVG